MMEDYVSENQTSEDVSTFQALVKKFKNQQKLAQIGGAMSPPAKPKMLPSINKNN